MPFKADLTGKRFGRLEVLRFHSVKKSPSGRPITLWTVKCDCGSPEKVVRYDCLVRGKTKSCGCVRRAVASGLPFSARAARLLNTGRLTYLPKHMAKAWHAYAGNAKRRKIGWGLTEREFSELVLSPCHYCGGVASGIDRKDRALGFVEGNTVPSCKLCASLRKKLPYADFLAHVQKIAARVRP